jgi:hypothetical protein
MHDEQEKHWIMLEFTIRSLRLGRQTLILVEVGLNLCPGGWSQPANAIHAHDGRVSLSRPILSVPRHAIHHLELVWGA